VIASTAHDVVVRLRWRSSGSSSDVELFQVLRLREGKIVDMQDHEDRSKALKALGHAA